LALFYERSLGYFGHRGKVMNNKDISVKLSDAIEKQDFKRAIDAVQVLRPIDIADIIALIYVI
jgi:magnesium transporter